jgi:hypothetical protein
MLGACNGDFLPLVVIFTFSLMKSLMRKIAGCFGG